jgi:hypothetical protein
MRRKIMAVFATLVVALGLTVITASPAQAWSYCSNPPQANNTFVGYGKQGYCTPGKWTFSDINPPGFCLSFAGRNYDNAFGAVSNTFDDRRIIFYGNSNCSGEYMILEPDTSHPNLAAQTTGNNGMFHEISALWYVDLSGQCPTCKAPPGIN